MLQPRLRAPFRVLERAFAPSLLSSSPLQSSQSFLSRTTSASPSSILKPTSSLPFLPLSIFRHASHATQGRANAKARDPAGKRLGAKKTGEQYVIPGNIIFRQRGTKWFPGENCAMGRDHTIYATEAGYVKYYLDPERHPNRKYIGVSFERDGILPTPRNAPTKRRLNMVEAPRVEVSEMAVESDLVTVEDGTTVAHVGATERANLPAAKTEVQLRPGYMYREANWQIGRAAEKAGITAKEFDRRNRWMAWRKRKARAERAAQMKSLKNKKKASKKGKGGR
ncbi:54S ribosomal protein L2 mitochondrial [Paecilomyces lecythidis]|uniref:Large ribosomal subunit protein bL27m n=1 Tax=Paecilomyces lecythidis TaxID=3004212 RepID=A0ABR3WUB1_9EURO